MKEEHAVFGYTTRFKAVNHRPQVELLKFQCRPLFIRVAERIVDLQILDTRNNASRSRLLKTILVWIFALVLGHFHRFSIRCQPSRETGSWRAEG